MKSRCQGSLIDQRGRGTMWGALWVVAALITVPAERVAGQQNTYRIQGTVVDATTEQPLANVAVTLTGAHVGTLSGASGRYELSARVAPGSYSLTYTLIGRETVSREIQLGTATTVDVPQVAMRESAIQLDEIVVTGTGGATQRRALGNAVSVVSGEAVANSRATTVDAALQGKVAGAQIMSNNGTPGGGVSIRLRGTSSIVAGAEPLFIVDGVIVDNSSDQQINFGYRTNPSNRLADLNPNDIERVEILKGAAAAALYGSRANNGVIQIFTKRGSAGETRIDVSTRATYGQLERELPFALTPVEPDGTPVERFDHQDLVFRNAWGNETSVSLSGGADQTRFFLSGNYAKDNGIMIGSSNERIGGRINIDQTVGNWLNLAAGFNYIRNQSDLLINGENGTGGVLTAIVFTNTNVNLAARDPDTGEFLIRQTTFPNPLEVVERWESPQTVNRFVGSFQARATPANLPSIEYRFGYDTYGMETDLFIPRGTPVSLTGSSTAVTRNQFLINNDIVANYTFGPASLQLTSTLGMNHTYSQEETVNASALDLTPTTELVRGAVQSATQNRFETATIGVFAQQQVAFGNRLFLTGALRWDASSTFGEDERWQLYPKVSGSYVVSEFDWWQESLGSLFSEFRLRGALGYAGNQPPVGSAYARIPRYTGVTNINRIGLVHLAAAGNPNLKPERQREYEIGFDAGLFQDRVGLAFTYYDQYITDLLLTRPFPPSSGYGSVLDNVGELSNKGLELQVNTRNVDVPDFGWNTTFTFSRNRNKVEKLAGSPFTEGYNNYVAEGHALGVWKLFDVKRDANGNVIEDDVGPVRTDTSVVMGDPNPDFQASLRNELRLGRNFTANILLDGVFGHDVWNQTVRIMDIFSAGPLYDRLLKGEITQAYRARIQGITGEYLEDASFVKLREISVSYLLPESFVDRLGFRSMSLEVAARNLYTFTDYTGYDPETNMFGTSTVARGTDFATYPNPRTFSFGVRAGF